MTPQPRKANVLVVDDHPANRLAFRTVLEPDYTVTVAEKGSQALELILENEYAVILLDVRMPGMDGFEVADLIRKQGRARNTPIIFLSAYDQNLTQMKRRYIAGATDFLSSPVDEELLKFKVAAHVRNFLRNESFRLQIDQLQAVVRSLEHEARQRGPAEDVFKMKIKELEGLIEEMQRQFQTVPS